MFEDLQDTAVSRRDRRHREDAEMDITPMIDVVFLLLIFFIVASRMDPKTAVDMPTAKHGVTVPQKDAAVLVVENTGGEEPNVYLGPSKDETALVKGDEDEREQQIEDFVRSELTASTPKIAVLIKAEKGIKFRYVDAVSKAASRGIDNKEEINIHIGIIEKR